MINTMADRTCLADTLDQQTWVLWHKYPTMSNFYCAIPRCKVRSYKVGPLHGPSSLGPVFLPRTGSRSKEAPQSSTVPGRNVDTGRLAFYCKLLSYKHDRDGYSYYPGGIFE